VRIALNTTCAVAGGAVTYLRHLLPAMTAHIGPDEITAIGDAATRSLLAPPTYLRWEETPALRGGLARRLLRENFDLVRRLRSLRADVLFHPGNFRVFRAAVPQVILIHNLAPFLPELIREESLSQRIRLPVLRNLTRSSLRQVSGAIFISEWGRRLVLGEGPADERRMPVIPFGAEHAAVGSDPAACARWSLAPGEYVLTASHFYRYKKIEKLIDAWVALGERVSSWPLLVAGEPFDRQYGRRLEELARSAKSRVIFTGRLDGDTLASLMEGCRVFVFTSEAENLPITLLEAMAAGCAIVTNRHCSMPETCRDAVLYADPAAAATYQRELERVLWDAELRIELRDRARRRAAEFRWSDAARRTLELLRDLGEADAKIAKHAPRAASRAASNGGR
jgi:glycosyltransferase involved in cell wall biosynthesis